MNFLLAKGLGGDLVIPEFKWGDQMLLKEVIGKEVIDLQGKKIGKIKKADIILEASNGEIESIILHNSNSKFVISWYGIKHIGSRVVIIDNSVSTLTSIS